MGEEGVDKRRSSSGKAFSYSQVRILSCMKFGEKRFQKRGTLNFRKKRGEFEQFRGTKVGNRKTSWRTEGRLNLGLHALNTRRGELVHPRD